jgi:hypothetical protein
METHIHSRQCTLLFVSLYCTGSHCNNRYTSYLRLISPWCFRPDGMGGGITVTNRHLVDTLSGRDLERSACTYLNIHQDDVWTRMRWSKLLCQIIQDLLSVPNRIHREVKLLDCFQGDLLVDVTVALSATNERAKETDSLVFYNKNVRVLALRFRYVGKLLRKLSSKRVRLHSRMPIYRLSGCQRRCVIFRAAN